MDTQHRPEILFTAPAGRVPSPGWAREYTHRVVTGPQIRQLKSLPWLTVVQVKAPGSFAKHKSFLSLLARITKHSPAPYKVVFLFSEGPRLRAHDFSSVLQWFPASSVEFAQGARNGALAVEEAWAKLQKEIGATPSASLEHDPLGRIKGVIDATSDLRAESGRLSAALVAEVFGIPIAEVARILGQSRQAVSKSPDAESRQKGLRLFERIARLRAVLPAKDFSAWLNMTRPELDNRAPIDLVRDRKVAKVADFAEDMLTGAPV